MDPFNQYFEKVGAFIVRRLDERPQLFLYSRRYDPNAPLQTPGGGVRDGETPEQALWREVEEETGYGPMPIIRKIGVSETPWLFRTVKRHCYLIDGTGLPESWVHTVSGDGIDQGEVYHYSWYATNEALSLAGDLSYFLTPEHLPELFPKRGDAVEAVA